ncbi:hypothetical protein Halru_0957 [Halovivax ruber XH-70]|uniref:Uncharacterized protein n=1 Tax=Halovivax ruber (strain DSM 18193 / JCM 13892 / XH-70) TaxID=797302 RepID=L0IBF4_HALRX|nr:hypothetical protein [Halovivax ruber]AGB15576.1 hypothetical protein Halru_0957 [Halovivax ruber XH-70]
MLRGGCATIVAGVTASAAGCLTDGEQANNSAEEYNSAVDLLKQNSEVFNEYGSQEELPDSFNKEEIHRRVNSAEQHLDEAKSGADDELSAKIDNAEAIAKYQRKAASYNALLVDQKHCMDSFGSLSSAERWEDANKKIKECVSGFDETEKALTETQSAYNDIDQELLDEEGRLEVEDLGDELQFEEETLNVVGELINSFDLFAEGMPVLMGGFEDYEAENWHSSQEKFEEARDTFAQSEGRLSELENDPDLPASFESDVVETRCYVDALREGTDYWAKSAAAANRRNWNDAEYYAQEGNTAFDRCSM